MNPADVSRWVNRRSWATALLLGVSASGALMSACQPGGPSEPEPASVAVRAEAAKRVNPTGPLRLAVIWMTQIGNHPGWVTTLDEPIEQVNATQRVSLQLPPISARASIIERSEVDIECGEDADYFTASVVVPRFVVYEDLDHNGTFNPNIPSLSGTDRVWAVTAPKSGATSLVAFEDLDAALSQQPTEIAECVREKTGGPYTAFFMGNYYTGYVTPTAASLAVALELTDTDYARVTLGCDTSVSSYPYDYTPTTIASRTAIIDTPATGITCVGSPFTCSEGDVSASLPSSLSSLQYPGYTWAATCTASGSLDVLWTFEYALKCDGCTCSWTENDAAWVVESTAAPVTWPCGKALKYCGPSQASAWSRPKYCDTLTTTRPL